MLTKLGLGQGEARRLGLKSQVPCWMPKFECPNSASELTVVYTHAGREQGDVCICGFLPPSCRVATKPRHSNVAHEPPKWCLTWHSFLHLANSLTDRFLLISLWHCLHACKTRLIPACQHCRLFFFMRDFWRRACTEKRTLIFSNSFSRMN